MFEKHVPLKPPSRFYRDVPKSIKSETQSENKQKNEKDQKQKQQINQRKKQAKTEANQRKKLADKDRTLRKKAILSGHLPIRDTSYLIIIPSNPIYSPIIIQVNKPKLKP